MCTYTKKADRFDTQNGTSKIKEQNSRSKRIRIGGRGGWGGGGGHGWPGGEIHGIKRMYRED